MNQKTSRSARWQVVLVALAAVLMMQAVSVACPFCKEAIPVDDAEAGRAGHATAAARGYAWSILVMIAIPFTMVGGAALILTSAYRRNLENQQRAAGGPDATPSEPPRDPPAS